MSGVKAHVMIKAVTVSFKYFGGFCSDVYFLDEALALCFQARFLNPKVEWTVY